MTKFLKFFQNWKFANFWTVVLRGGSVAHRSLPRYFSKRVRLLLWMQTGLFKNKTGLFISQYYPFAKNSQSFKPFNQDLCSTTPTHFFHSALCLRVGSGNGFWTDDEWAPNTVSFGKYRSKNWIFRKYKIFYS